MRYSLPASPADGDCFVVLFGVELLPIISGVLSFLEEDRAWIASDFPQAYNRIVEIEANMGLMCARDLIESNNRIYRLLDWSLNGRVYDAGDNPPDSITPSIPAVPPSTVLSPGMVRTQVIIRNALTNFFNGDINSDFAETPSARSLLQGIIDAVNASGTESGDILTQLELIAALLA